MSKKRGCVASPFFILAHNVIFHPFLFSDIKIPRSSGILRDRFLFTSFILSSFILSSNMIPQSSAIVFFSKVEAIWNLICRTRLVSLRGAFVHETSFLFASFNLSSNAALKYRALSLLFFSKAPKAFEGHFESHLPDEANFQIFEL